MHVGSNQISFINQLVTFVELHKRTSNRLKATTILLLSFSPLPLTAVEEIIPPSVALMHTFPLPPHRRGRGSLEGGARRACTHTYMAHGMCHRPPSFPLTHHFWSLMSRKPGSWSGPEPGKGRGCGWTPETQEQGRPVGMREHTETESVQRNKTRIREPYLNSARRGFLLSTNKARHVNQVYRTVSEN